MFKTEFIAVDYVTINGTNYVRFTHIPTMATLVCSPQDAAWRWQQRQLDWFAKFAASLPLFKCNGAYNTKGKKLGSVGQHRYKLKEENVISFSSKEWGVLRQYLAYDYLTKDTPPHISAKFWKEFLGKVTGASVEITEEETASQFGKVVAECICTCVSELRETLGGLNPSCVLDPPLNVVVYEDAAGKRAARITPHVEIVEYGNDLDALLFGDDPPLDDDFC
jgi:hypothetical protein